MIDDYVAQSAGTIDLEVNHDPYVDNRVDDVDVTVTAPFRPGGGAGFLLLQASSGYGAGSWFSLHDNLVPGVYAVDANGNGVADDSEGGDVHNDGVVVATPLTDAQRAAWQSAYNRAASELHLSNYLLSAGIAAGGYRIGGYFGAIGTVLIERTIDDMDEAALDGLANTYYELDGSDGAYDGVINNIYPTSPLPVYP